MFRIGADPEVFLLDAQNAFVSAIDKIGGSKEEPLPLPIGDGFAVQEDNVAIEYNIPPADSKPQLINNINAVMQHLRQRVDAIGLHFSDVSAVEFPIEELMHPKAQEFGCDPDFNAWRGGAVNPRPKADSMALRSCGGHVHIGHSFKSRQDALECIKFIDLHLGVPSTIMDTGELRKQLYGKAGACRFKPYGMEYRVLSNYWIFKDELIGWVWDATARAMDAWQNQTIDVNAERELIINAINRNDKQATRTLINRYNLLMA